MRKDRPQRLGRGLSSLLGDDETSEPLREMVNAALIGSLHPGRFQPRRRFDEAGITSLVDSIRQRGILQPILVRPLIESPGHYEIIAGERRWRAAQQAQLHEVPIIVRDLPDREALEVGLVENLQRQDLSPLEEAEGYSRLIEEFHHTQEELARAISKSRSHVANMIRLLALPNFVKAMLDQGTLSVGHARALLGAHEPIRLAKVIVSRGLNVRQTERLIQNEDGKLKTGHAVRSRDADLVTLERNISNRLGLRVHISFRSQGGDLTIYYNTLEQLDDILLRLNANATASLHPSSDLAFAVPADQAREEDDRRRDSGTTESEE